MIYRLYANYSNKNYNIAICRVNFPRTDFMYLYSLYVKDIQKESIYDNIYI